MATRWGVTLLRASVFSPSEDEKHQRYTIDIRQNSCLASGRQHPFIDSKHYFYNYGFTVLSLIKINNYEKEIVTLLFEVLILSTLEALGGVMAHMGPPTIDTSNASRRLPHWHLSTPSPIWAHQSLTQLTLPDASPTIVKKIHILCRFLVGFLFRLLKIREIYLD